MKRVSTLIVCLVLTTLLVTGCSHVKYSAARQRRNVSSFADNFRGGEPLVSRTQRTVAAYNKPLYFEKRGKAFSDNFWTSPLETRLSSNPYDYARPQEVVVKPDPDDFLIQNILASLPY